jgi:ElaB/YqjD/DUF883 family membrane-anchored ribosome-binding protein
MAKGAKNSRADAERAVQEMQKEFEKRIDAIRTELKEKGPEAVEKSLGELKTGFEGRLDDVRESIENARESLDDVLETGRTTIQERPLMAVGVAVAVGVVIGLLLGRKSKN